MIYFLLKQLGNTAENLSENSIQENVLAESTSLSPDNNENAQLFEKNLALFYLKATIPIFYCIFNSTMHCF